MDMVFTIRIMPTTPIITGITILLIMELRTTAITATITEAVPTIANMRETREMEGTTVAAMHGRKTTKTQHVRSTGEMCEQTIAAAGTTTGRPGPSAIRATSTPVPRVPITNVPDRPNTTTATPATTTTEAGTSTVQQNRTTTPTPLRQAVLPEVREAT